MSSLTLPEISTLPSLPASSHSSILDTLFEPSSELHTLATPILARETFSSYNSLIEAIGACLLALLATNSPHDRQVLEGILRSHPRLGESAPAARTQLSALSRQEQANLNNGDRGETARKEAEVLNRLNRAYEEKFVGLRYVYVALFFETVRAPL
jgi:2-oxo-4-hydroxy-4-carboxy--5-ureidoimidazoline (OHCU) decarboxylase